MYFNTTEVIRQRRWLAAKYGHYDTICTEER